MTRMALAGNGSWAAVVLAACLTIGCSPKPTEEACDKAVANIRKVTGQTHTEVGGDERAAVRSCRAQSSRDTVECYAAAQTEQELFACGGELAESLRKAQEKTEPAGARTGSGSGAESGSGKTSGSGTGQ